MSSSPIPGHGSGAVQTVDESRAPAPRPSVTPAPAWLGKKVGRFKLLSLLGEGAMGRVFQVEDTLLQRYAALKILPKALKRANHSTAVELLLHEARAAAALDHPCVVRILEVNESNGIHYIAMELVEGGSIADLVRAAGPMEYPRACLLAADAAEGLEHAHQMGIVHRDVKPSNLVLTRSGRCKVTDFGLALVGPGSLSASLSSSVGTPRYISPEVTRGGALTAQSDVYSLGATLWYMLTGRPPFAGDNVAELLDRHANCPLPNLAALRPDLPASLVAAIKKALAKDPTDRFDSAAQFEKVLRVHTIPVDPASGSLSTLAEVVQGVRLIPETRLRPLRDQLLAAWRSATPNFKLGLAAAAALVLAMIGLLAWSASSRRPTPALASASTPATPQPEQPPRRDTPRTPPAAAQATPVVARTTQIVPRPPRETRTDLLKGLDLDSASVKGTWSRDGADLLSDHSGPAILEFPNVVPAEYDFVIEFTSQDCVQQLLYKPAITPGAAGTPFNWCMAVGDAFGFESINGKHVFDDGAATTQRLAFKHGVRHTSLVKVRKDGVQAWLDGKLIAEHKTDYRDVSRMGDWSFRNDDKLGIGTWSKPSRFHKAELIEWR